MHEIFLDELKKLNTQFMEMGVSVNDAIDHATRAFVDHDKKTSQKMVDDEERIPEESLDIQKKALKLMALQQPVATDFRVVISILKATTDLERIGENAMSIAWETIRVKGNPRIPEVEEIISSMTHDVRHMLIQVLTAYVQDDEKMAKEVAAKDTKIDEAYVKARKLIVDGIENDPSKAVASSSYFVVTRLLERIGDHIVNLAMWVVYKTTGELNELVNPTEEKTI
ncbi:phosphate signaling complex protein PhoU [Lactobacillus intestinalis]|uniref:Phosphate-specific transport system accessory protein PhoU n=1 Tax=Lactobacillus intestinalis DSM 6629 TaxID=1423761 RepID=A0ABR5PTU1_9LACO|nr:phosphate signaling complex protein PhoU [Lactobacillus intestinalis]KRM34343.1 phosphate transport system regulatory protein PhoU [Lactobacillus intestinalis DSM 6629]UTW40661.1 phosphate signaling complex protein PhoU [Lactobacillus intestinalis]